jgi:2-keto-4-pentenoate hydratase/2-oxohepta-3-ene-1,7-dioic acid hydratase in catechol pathway
MKLVTFRGADQAERLGVLVDDEERIADCTAARPDEPALRSMQQLIEAGDSALELVREVAAEADSTVPLEEARLLPPVPVPAQMRDCLCFEEHLVNAFRIARELAVQRAEDPEAMRREVEERNLFAVPDVWYRQPIYYKANRFACSGHGDDVSWPAYSSMLDFELEFGAWIGSAAKDVPAGDALSHIFGYSIFNDFSARDAQMVELPGQLGPAKSKDFDGANAIGPCIVTADEIDPYDLTMVARINGEEVARGSTSTMHWRFEDVIAHVSASETLHPGEFLGSGTVGGGCGLEIGRFLQPGDEVELEVSGIGVLRNRVVKEEADGNDGLHEGSARARRGTVRLPAA